MWGMRGERREVEKGKDNKVWREEIIMKGEKRLGEKNGRKKKKDWKRERIKGNKMWR